MGAHSLSRSDHSTLMTLRQPRDFVPRMVLEVVVVAIVEEGANLF
jgi:hypothetical protein